MRRLPRVLTVALLTVWTLVTLPALAYAFVGEHGDPRPLGPVNEILIFGVGPIGVFLLVALITLRPQRSSGASRYRPGRGWGYGPVWFGTRGAQPVEPAADAPASPGHGGAGASW